HMLSSVLIFSTPATPPTCTLSLHDALPISCLACGQKAGSPTPAQAVQAVREYRMENENRIVRELSEFLAIPNIASDTSNIQKNRSEEHTSELQSLRHLVCRLLLEKKNQQKKSSFLDSLARNNNIPVIRGRRPYIRQAILQ